MAGRKRLFEKPLIKMAIAIPEEVCRVVGREAKKDGIAVSQAIRRILVRYARIHK